MYAGRAVERAPTRKLFAHVRMPYTRALLDAIPRLENASHTPTGGRAGTAARTWRSASPGARSRRAAQTRPTNAASTPPPSRSTSRVICGRAGIHAPTRDRCEYRRAAARRPQPGPGVRGPRAGRRPQRDRAGGVRRLVHASRKARRSGWSARPGPGNRRWPERSCRRRGRRRVRCCSRASTWSSSRGASCCGARRQLQMVFQDPFGSLDPKWSVTPHRRGAADRVPDGTRDERRRRVAEVLELVGLDPARYGERRPRSLSGGQAQRVAIARALALDPALIIYDEAVSSLDVLIRAQVLNLLERLRAELSLTYLFIAHDLALVKQVSDRVAVMYLGKLVEIGPAESLYREPLHPYTVALLASIPNPDPTAPRAGPTRDDPRRAALADRSPERLPVPDPLPARAGRLRRRWSRRFAGWPTGTSLPATSRFRGTRRHPQATVSPGQARRQEDPDGPAATDRHARRPRAADRRHATDRRRMGARHAAARRSRSRTRPPARCWHTCRAPVRPISPTRSPRPRRHSRRGATRVPSRRGQLLLDWAARCREHASEIDLLERLEVGRPKWGPARRCRASSPSPPAWPTR